MDATQKSQLDTFVWESREHLDLLEPALLRLQQEPQNSELINSIFRAAHSIKGGAGFFGLTHIQELSHGMENLMTRVREGEAPVTPALLDLLLACLDVLRVMIDDPASSEQVDISRVMDRIRRAFDPREPDGAEAPPAGTSGASGPDLSPFHVTPDQVDDVIKKSLFVYKARFYRDRRAAPVNYLARMQSVGTVLDAVTHVPESPESETADPECVALFASVLQEDMIDIALDIPRDHYESVSPEALKAYALEGAGESQPRTKSAAPAKDVSELPAPVARTSEGGGPEQRAAGKIEDTVRLPVSLLDDLMNLAGELVLGRNQLLMLSDQLSDRVNGFTPALRNIDRVATGLRDKVMSTRLQPLGNLFNRFKRVIRDLASDLNKQIELRIEGSEVELDKSLIEQLSDPLTHLVRNCADHGIETTVERGAAGKTPAGRITLSASHQGGRVFIRISDDGRGMDSEKVRRKIVERGMARAEDAAMMSQRQVLKYVFLPGFSTAERVTGLSGRGVGMDVVKNNVERMGGSVDLESRTGQGTCITLCLPLTVAVAPAMIVGVRDRIFALPQVQLEELVSLKNGMTLEQIRGAPVIRLRGRLLPVVNVAELLNIHGETGGGKEPFAEAAGPGAQYVAVIKANQDRFGLLVDQVMDEEEIVVKPLSAYVRQCPCYSGATVLGNGRIVLILDTAGIVNYAGLQFPDDNSEQQSRREEEQRRRQTETQHLLLFRNAPDDLFAVNQELIARIEKISTADIYTAAHMEFVNYRDDALRVLRLHHYMPVEAPASSPEHYFMLVPKLVKKPMGILCAAVEDVVDVNVALDRDRVKGVGVMGSALIRDELALFLDIYSLFEAVDPELYAHTRHPQILPGKHILLAEDTLFFRTLVSQYLESLGCAVDVAQDGIEALDFLNRRTYDMLVTDLEMPGMDGFELTEQVRASARFHDLPVVALSSISKTRYLNRALAAGVDAYESKIDKEQLRITMERVFSGGGKSEGLIGLPERTAAEDLFDLDPLEMDSFSEEHRP